MESRPVKDHSFLTPEEQEKDEKLMFGSGRQYRRAVRASRRAQTKKRPGVDRVTSRFSAREWFAYLRPILLGSRPVEGFDKHGNPVFGKPTFKNAINEDGEHY